MYAQQYNRLSRYGQRLTASKRRKANKSNSGIATLTQTHIQHNRQRVDTSQVRYETLLDKQYMVLPVVMMVEGVHNGSTALYYPSDELSRVPVGWNMKPIVVYHPAHGSATDPVELQTRMVGHIMNCRWDGKLRADAWVIPERLEAIAPEVFERLKKGETIEVSTGLYCDFEKESGTWNDEDFELVGRNIVADHLAILPDMVGACSIKDGCGLLSNHQTRIPMFSDGSCLVEPVCNQSKKESVPMFITQEHTPPPAPSIFGNHTTNNATPGDGLALPVMNFESCGCGDNEGLHVKNANVDGLPLPTTMNAACGCGNRTVNESRVVHNDHDVLPLPSMY